MGNIRKQAKKNIKATVKAGKKAQKAIKQTIALRETRKRAIKARQKRAIETPIAISPRHKADLVQPQKAFKYKRAPSVGLLSTAIHSFDYDDQTKTLKITFTKVRIRNGVISIVGVGGTYIYFQVPRSVYEGLLKASSKGRYYNKFIKHKYTHKRLR